MLLDFVQPLEARRLLSTTIAYVDANRTLNVTSDKEADNIRLEVSPAANSQSDDYKHNTIRVYVDGKLVFNSAEFSRDPIEIVHMDGGGGNDSMQVDLIRPGKLMVWVDGGEGDDAIATESQGGRGIQVSGGEGDDAIKATDCYDARSTVSGDAGNDRIYSTVRECKNGNIVLGGAGNDFIWLEADTSSKNGFDCDAGTGDDMVLGSIRSDKIDLADGNDEAHAGDGEDKIQGGQGADRLFGDDGDDTMDSGADSADDYVDGGAGMDHAIVGSNDKIVDVEELM